MNAPGSSDERLEALVRRTLQGLPDRAAPADLEARVLALLEARAALPWWRTPFAVWPMAARGAFVLLCLALVVLTVYLGRGQHFEAPSLWARRGWEMVSAVAGFFALFGRIVPASWAYAALGIGGALYALLFGLGAIVYRTLYLPSYKR